MSGQPIVEPEAIDDLIALALSGDREDKTAWEAVAKLHRFGTREILDKAIGLSQSPDPIQRARGADILGQLGVKPGIHSKSFVPDRLQALVSLVRLESDTLPLAAAITALGHLSEPSGIRSVLPFASHPNENVRYAVAWALPSGLDRDPDVIATLLCLTQDSDSDVRDWATFGLGTQSDADSEPIRDALIARLADIDEDTRAEAAVGLAKRHDLRVLPVVLHELEQDEYGTLYEEAAAHLLGLAEDMPQDWESWKYVDELKARYNLAREKADLPPQ